MAEEAAVESISSAASITGRGGEFTTSGIPGRYGRYFYNEV